MIELGPCILTFTYYYINYDKPKFYRHGSPDRGSWWLPDGF